MRSHSISVGDIEVGERHRALSSDAVDRLSASMKEVGLINPVSVRLVEEMEVDGHLTAGVPVLVAGRHRLEAAKRLGWSHIDCIEVDDDDITAELWEIAENLHRLDLTKDQRDEQIRRYADLLERQKLQSPHFAVIESKREDGRGHRPKSVAKEIADATGLSDDTVRRALSPKPPVMLKSVKEAETDEEAILRETNAIVGAWNRARQEARDLAMEQIDMPVFDRTRSAA